MLCSGGVVPGRERRRELHDEGTVVLAVMSRTVSVVVFAVLISVRVSVNV